MAYYQWYRKALLGNDSVKFTDMFNKTYTNQTLENCPSIVLIYRTF